MAHLLILVCLFAALGCGTCDDAGVGVARTFEGLPITKPEQSFVKEGKRKAGLFRHLVAPQEDVSPPGGKCTDCGDPLFLSPLIKDGKIKEALNMSRVQLPNDQGSTRSYSGYLSVDEPNGSQMFFWFFPAKVAKPEVAPVLIWLQGGPGGSSLFGLFSENGPFNVDENLNLVYRNYSWTNMHNVIYFDNPVGTGAPSLNVTSIDPKSNTTSSKYKLCSGYSATVFFNNEDEIVIDGIQLIALMEEGFSFTKTDEGYVTNEAEVGEALYSALQQFLTLFPALRRNELYVSGESYAGKYVPALSYAIHKHNPSAEAKINFKGMAIGDGLCDPITMLDYGDFLYDIGLLDEVQRDLFRAKQVEARSLIDKRLWREAALSFDRLLNADTINSSSTFTNATGLTFYYNYLMEREPADMGYYVKYINQPEVRRAIHVGDLVFNDGKAVEDHLLEDMMQSVKPWIEELMNQEKYRVMIYNGQLDVIIAYPLTRNFVESMQWRDSDKYLSAPRRIWKVGGDVAGYVKETPNFVEVLVRGAGHMVPYDQPERAYDMINRFTGAGTSATPSTFFGREND